MSTSVAVAAGHFPVFQGVAAKPAKAAKAGLLPTPQTVSLAFTKSNSAGVDAAVKIGDVNLDAATTKLVLNLNLNAGRKYTFNGNYGSGGPKVTLTDSSGKKTTVKMTTGFSVAKSGVYQLSFETPYTLKSLPSFDLIAINAKSVLPTSSGDKHIDALLRGGTDQWWHGYDAAAAKGTEAITPAAKGLVAGSSATNLTFSFLTSQPAGQSMAGFQEMTAAQKSAVRKAFDYYSKLVNVTFTEVSGDGAGEINFGTNDQASSAGYANPPNGSGVKDKDFLFLANNAASNGDSGMAEGGYGWMTILHEIAHTLGLKHPGNYNAGGGGTPGPYLAAGEDDRQHSIMSYKDNNATRGVNVTTPMVYDVAALQYLYGANKSASTSTNGAFTFTAGQSYLQTLWSATGTDSIDLSGLTNASQVNLNAGTYSNINITGAAASSFYSGNKNVGIAYGSKINSVTLSATNGVAESVTLNNAYASGAYDSIASFDATDDKINLKTSFFGKLSAKNIVFGDAATTSTTKIIVNNSTGEIFYDPDGKGKQAAKKIAQYTAVAGRGTVSASNFSFVA